ncbi:hypothetical protein HDU76_003648 [Blyttiomyces sp. JEL0837]|nr:hypothetical protein HDU76_003648 [Blyttiomyces sp. JEL0837]
MPSVSLLQRGIIYFIIKGTTVLPLLKHGMDVYFYKKYLYEQGHDEPCQKLLFPLVCYDDLGTTFNFYTEVGCESVATLLVFILVGFHTLLALIFLFTSCGKNRSGFFLAALEDGCCGVAGVVLSVGAYDVEVDVHRKSANKWRRVIRAITGMFQVVIIVALASATHIVTQDYVMDVQRSSLFVLLPALLLNIYSMIDNFAEGATVLFE